MVILKLSCCENYTNTDLNNTWYNVLMFYISAPIFCFYYFNIQNKLTVLDIYYSILEKMVLTNR